MGHSEQKKPVWSTLLVLVTFEAKTPQQVGSTALLKLGVGGVWDFHPGCDLLLFSLLGKWTSDLSYLTLLLRAERGNVAPKVPAEHAR